MNKIYNAFKEREPILREELGEVLEITNNNTLNQKISFLVTSGILNRFENGIYYIPSKNDKFSSLRPSLVDILKKKYFKEHEGIRTGSYLMYKYKLTDQVSSYYEILTNEVSKSTRSKHLYDGKVIVSHPPFVINEENYKYLEMLELVKNYKNSDYSDKITFNKIFDEIEKLELNKEKLIKYSDYYKGKKHGKFRENIKGLLLNETTRE